jgi:hypothetical protein
MKLDPGMHIGLHLVFFGKSGVTEDEAASVEDHEGHRREEEGP